ncbi:hypothetical protein EH196_19330 [Bacillus sp. C1-1]|nr:hypothetical protein EH196_19330 [Bacillus sp. C1-1]
MGVVVMDISIYKLIISKKVFKRYLNDKLMRKRGNTQKLTSEITLEDGKAEEKEIILEYYYKKSSVDVPVDWAEYWGSFFNDGVTRTKKIESTFGMVVITFDDNVYAIPLGRGYSFANSFADLNFGFDIAEIIHDEKTIDVKSAKYLKQSKSKSLTQYNNNAYVNKEIGESHELIISGIVIDEKYKKFTLYRYSEKMKFSNAVKFSAERYKPKEIIRIVHELSSLLIIGEKNSSLPRMHFLKKEGDDRKIVDELNNKLLEAIKKEDSKIILSHYVIDEGQTFIEPVNGEEVELVYKKKYPLKNFNLSSISKAVIKSEATDLSKVSIQPVYDKDRKMSILRLLDYQLEINGKSYCLIRGAWAGFNNSYMEFINKEIMEVNKYASYEEDFNLDETKIEKGAEYQALYPEEYQSVKYTEYLYNIYLKNRNEWKLLDREVKHEEFKKVEFADLYDEGSEGLIHVKIGTPNSLRYCIQQSLNSTKIYNSKEGLLKNYEINNVSKVGMLFVVDSQNIINNNKVDFSRSQSIYFKIELIDWMDQVRSMRYEPYIIIAKDNRLK